MRIWLFKVLTRTGLAFAMLLPAMATTPGCEEQTEPSLVPPEIESPAPATAPAPSPSPSMLPPSNAGGADASSGVPAAPRTTAEYRKAADAGDVASMLLLARSHESLGQRDEARKWYTRAAAKGNDDAKAALAALEAPPPSVTQPSSPSPSSSSLPRASTAPAEGDIAGIGKGSSQALSGPATRRVATAPLPPGEPGKLRWIDVTAVLNYEDIVSAGGMTAEPTQPRSGKQVFIGKLASRDSGIVVAAMGPSETDLTELTTVIRVRNKVEPGSSPRVAQAAAVAARVTADNVNQRELLEWVTRYLQTEQRSEPIFRNGWRISVSGFAAEGGPRDRAPHLGTAVMIEMKK
jgi:hypothetical protein